MTKPAVILFTHLQPISIMNCYLWLRLSLCFGQKYSYRSSLRTSFRGTRGPYNEVLKSITIHICRHKWCAKIVTCPTALNCQRWLQVKAWFLCTIKHIYCSSVLKGIGTCNKIVAGYHALFEWNLNCLFFRVEVRIKVWWQLLLLQITSSHNFPPPCPGRWIPYLSSSLALLSINELVSSGDLWSKSC